MLASDVKLAIIGVLEKIQALSGLGCPVLDGDTVPPNALPRFDSTVWPLATTMIGRKLGVDIPYDVHIFGGENGACLLTIDQSAALICAKSKPQASAKAA